MIVAGSRREIAPHQARTWMRQSMRFQRYPFLEPGLQLWLLRRDRDRHDADSRAAIDLLQTIKNRAKEFLPTLRLRHVVNGQYHDRLDAGFSNPLRCDEFRETSAHVE